MLRLITTRALPACLALLLLTAPSALAAGGDQIGQNIGHLFGSWAKSIFVGVCAVAALVFVVNRRFQELAIFVVIAFVVGGFVIAPTAVGGTIHDVWKTVTGK